MLSFGFPPISSPSAVVLVLGSLPGRQSLERGEYYANPQNAFWKIIAAGVPELPSTYAGRVAALIERRIAVWDVLAAATRPGSLDAAIAEDAIPIISGRSSMLIQTSNSSVLREQRLYERHVLSTLSEEQRSLAREKLPSTSSAHASLSVAEKKAHWSVLWSSM